MSSTFAEKESDQLVTGPCLAVLLSTKNGARFIRHQMRSILSQTYPVQVYWRDDGSTDDTVKILSSEYDLEPYETNPLGVVPSYVKLLQIAYEDGNEYFAFADQDDIWLNDKIQRGMEKLHGLSNPALYCARQILVDDKMHWIGKSPPLRDPIGFPAALTQNIATGCTIILNRTAAELVIRTLRHGQKYHDWWCYLIISAVGGQIIADEREVMLYRQHDSNAIGSPRTFGQRAIAAVQRGPRGFMDVFRSHVDILMLYRDLLTQEACDALDTIIQANSLLAKMKALRLSGFRRQTLSEDYVFRLWFISY